MEHREIEAFLARIEALAASGSRQEVLEKGGKQQVGLSDVLRSHNLKEENVLYPTSDQMFRGEEDTLTENFGNRALYSAR